MAGVVIIGSMRALLKMGSISNSIGGVLSAVTNKASQRCLNFFKGCFTTLLGCFITPLTIGKDENGATLPILIRTSTTELRNFDYTELYYDEIITCMNSY